MAKEETIKMQGTILELLPNAMFKVSITESHTIIGYISGRMRQNEIKVLVGDTVEIEFSPYDLSRGRVVKRL
jgi:translation initiation factor IF-1